MHAYRLQDNGEDIRVEVNEEHVWMMEKIARTGSNHCIFLRVDVATSNLRPLTLSSMLFGGESVRTRFSVMVERE